MLRRRKVPLSLDELLEEAATAGLPDRYRTAVLFKDGLGLPAEQVAAAMGITVPATRSVLHRARAELRERLAGAVRG